MLRIDGRRRTACDGITRRTLLEAAGTGLLGLSLPALLGAEARGGPRPASKARSVIFLYLFGGPSQLETFDLKPEAPDRIRGPFRPIASRTPGLRIGEHLPRLAGVSDKFCVVRSMTHPYNDHSGAAHYMQTGRMWQVPIGGGFNPTAQDWPAMGSVVEYLAQQSPGGMTRPMPSYAVLPNSLGRLQEAGQYLRPGEHAGWLGRRYNPLTTTVDKKDLADNPYFRDCKDEELTFAIEGLAVDAGPRLEGIRRRASLLEQFDEGRRDVDQARSAADFDRFHHRALAMATSEATRLALDIRQEPSRIRDRYGRHLFGQATLVARRLVEAGVRFVTVHYDACDGYGWDSHVHSDDVKDRLLPTFDQALSALLVDLDERGLLAETLVVAVGEMGRTPQATARWGRGHWSTLFPAVLAGGGIRGGTMFGGSDNDAAQPVDHPVSPERLAATIYHALGIDPELRLVDPQGRPVPIVDQAEPVLELFG
ncbi:DUF1501 domain-containing protein [Tundrisphaera lichenicola]|uniref:DUF1501 domain-containing protein n=1 Tax=Tundrisphaera lichenicola TaxID=2029860 RepID=UPI003EBCE274